MGKFADKIMGLFRRSIQAGFTTSSEVRETHMQFMDAEEYLIYAEVDGKQVKGTEVTWEMMCKDTFCWRFYEDYSI